MTRIIFVDDDSRVLDGIRRFLYPMREVWQISFAGSGSQALEIMSRDPFDVIVTDIRMPGMDGTELLARVRELHPGAVRIVLSGQSDRDLTLKAAGSAHQYLSKPCDADSLKVTIARAVALKATFTDPSLQALVSGAGTLPSIPAVYVELMKSLEDPEGCAQDVANAIAKDPAMTAKILQLSNSAFFGLRRRISDPRDAVLYLGLETLKALALSVKVFSQFTVKPLSRFSIEDLGKHLMLTGILARKIAIAEGLPKQEVEDSFMAGLLHDIGKLVLITAAPEKYEQAMRLAELTGVQRRDAEQETFGTTHSEIGTYLLWLWGLPDSVVEAVAYHHTPGNCPALRLGPLTAVHAANALAYESAGKKTGTPTPTLDMEYLNQLGLGDRVPVWRTLIEQAAREQRAA
jgi:HD-like signal output (HDOD) protein/CheY-like chemotaxis protein